MPIFIRDYVWKQTDSTILINIPIKYVQSSKLNFYSTNDFIKINYESFIFELFLYKSIVTSESKCIIKKNEISLELKKTESGIWESLGKNVDRKDTAGKIEQILLEEHENEKITAKQEKEKKEDIKKFLKEEMMDQHMKTKEIIEQAKKKMISATIKEVVSWEDNLKRISREHWAQKSNEVKIPASIPFARKCETISFSFTPRVFPTPKRHSKTAEEEEWLKKEAEARSCIGFVAEDLSPEEKNPSWLLSKGERFMKHKNYLAAVNAFAYGNQLRPKMPIFYVRLADAHLKLNHFYEAVQNATKAIDLLQPVVQENKNIKAEAYNIRSSAFRSIGEISLSNADEEMAKSLLAK